MQLLQPAIGLLFWMTVVFGLLVFLLKKFAWAPIMSALKEREESIDSALRMAEETRKEMAQLKANNEKVQAEAKAQRDEIIKEAKETADGMVAAAREAARVASEQETAKAREAILNERNAMVANMRKEVATLSVEIAEKVLRKELSDKNAQSQLITDLISDAKLN